MNLVLSQPWVQKLGWTLIQFLWQGTVVAVGFAILRALSRRALSAQGRYVLSCCTMAAMASLPVLTLFVQTDSTRVSVTPWPLASPDAWRSVLPWLVFGWLAGAVGFTIRFAMGWICSVRLRRTCTTPLPPEWTACLEELMARLHVSRPVQFLQSALVDAPMMTGWLRPMVLIPVGMLTGLSPEYVRALLAHELAHVRRFDYFINILQSGVEAVLFYHPAVWWISDQIRAEREECCDDLAVAASGDVLVYARALAELETRRAASRGLALAANGGPLLRRIRRLVQPAVTEQSIPGPAAAVMSVLWLISMGAAVAHGSPAKHVAATPPPLTASQPVEATTPLAPVAAPAKIALNRGVRVSPLLLSPFGPQAPPQQTPVNPAQEAATPAPTAALDPPKTARVEGTVVSSAGGPVRGADVRVVAILPNGQAVGEAHNAVSDENGKFVVEGIDPSPNIGLSATKAGYSRARYGAKSETAPIVAFPLQPGETLKDLVLTMIQQAVLTGVVRDADGDPLPGSRVTSLSRGYLNGVRQLSMSNSAQANDIGEFRLAGLAPGRYYVLVSSTQEFGKGIIALPTFYPNAADVQNASLVEVMAGEQKRLEIRMKQGKKYAVRGKVMSSPNPNDANAPTTIRAIPDVGTGATTAGLDQNSPDSTAIVNSDGSFELHLASGNYVLRATSTVGNPQPVPVSGQVIVVGNLVNLASQSMIASLPIKVSDADLNGVIVTQPVSFTITGRVTVEDGSLADVATAAANLAATNGRGGAIAIAAGANGRGAPVAGGFRLTLNPVEQANRALNAAVNADGTFMIERVQPGHYNFSQGTIPATYIKTLRWDGSDVTGKELDIESGGTLEIVFRGGAVRVTGAATNDKGEPQGGAMVVLWPDRPLPAFAYAGARMVASDNKGGFSLPAVRPGTYYAIALEDANGNSAWLPDLLTQFSAQAVKVEIKENTPVTAATTVIPAAKVHEALEKLP